MSEDDAPTLGALIETLSQRPPERIPTMLHELAEDLAKIRAGTGPQPSQLSASPQLENWTIAVACGELRPIGDVVGHPILGSRPIATSAVWALDPDKKWARTLSRWYALGLPAWAEPEHGHSNLH